MYLLVRSQALGCTFGCVRVSSLDLGRVRIVVIFTRCTRSSFCCCCCRCCCYFPSSVDSCSLPIAVIFTVVPVVVVVVVVVVSDSMHNRASSSSKHIASSEPTPMCSVVWLTFARQHTNLRHSFGSWYKFKWV